MKLLKLTFAIAATGMLLGAGQAAYAVTAVGASYTYVFTGNLEAGNTNFDGSTITVTGNSTSYEITSWNLIDNGGARDANGNPVVVDFTPANSSILSEQVAITANSWIGDFAIWDGPFAASDPNSIADTFYGYSDGTGASNGGDLNDSFTDPVGSWLPQTSSVPDALNNFQLLAIALGALGASSLFFRRPKAALVRK
jgi:hypothetical protein